MCRILKIIPAVKCSRITFQNQLLAWQQIVDTSRKAKHTCILRAERSQIYIAICHDEDDFFEKSVKGKNINLIEV